MRVILFLLISLVSLAAEVPRIKLETYVKAERAAGRTPDIIKEFGHDLWGTNFSDLDLSGVKFTNCELGDCKFHRSILKKAVFHGAHVYLAEFHKADLQKADFVSCDINRCSFDGADLRGSFGFGAREAIDVSAKGANFSGLDLSRCILTDVDFSHSNLSNCVLTRADLTHSTFKETNLENVTADRTFLLNVRDISPAHVAQLEKTGAIGSQRAMEKAVREGMSFKGMNLRYSQFIGFNLSGADFSGAQIRHANFQGAKLNGARFIGSELTYVDFTSASLNSATFERAGCMMAKFNHADLTDASFRSADLDGAQFDGAMCMHTDFGSAFVHLADFRNAQGSSFPSLEQLESDSGLVWHEFLRALEKFIIAALPLAGIIALIVIICCTVKMSQKNQKNQKARWLKPILSITYTGIVLSIFSCMILVSSLGPGTALFALGALCIGPMVCLFGIFIGIHHLANGRKKPNWPCILFFLSSPFPSFGVLSVVAQVVAGMG